MVCVVWFVIYQITIFIAFFVVRFVAILFENAEHEVRTGETAGGKETFKVVIPAGGD